MAHELFTPIHRLFNRFPRYEYGLETPILTRLECVHPSLAGRRAIQITDLHLDRYQTRHNTVLRHIVELEPDWIFVTGDLLNVPEGFPHLVRFLSNLRSIAPVFMTLGNHDHYSGVSVDRFRQLAEEHDLTIPLLRDEDNRVAENDVTAFGVEPDDFNGYSILLPDFDSYQHERRTWFAKGLGTSALAAAQPEGNRLLAPLLRVETTDCNDNAVPDACDLNDGTLHDADGDLVPDECPCPRDMTGDHFIDGLDVAQLISSWGPCNGCRADINRSSSVDVVDLLLLLQDWGPCP